MPRDITPQVQAVLDTFDSCPITEGRHDWREETYFDCYICDKCGYHLDGISMLKVREG